MKVFIGLLLTVCLPSILAISPALILTDLILQNRTEQARDLAAVDPALFLGRTSYSGFFKVDEKYNSSLFFWYIEAENHSRDTPWIVWLQGGPGVTSLAGLFDEIGPFQMKDDGGKNISAREWTWAKDHSLFFIDNPVGAGFSFTDEAGLPDSVDKCAAHLYSALRQFLRVFPELRKAPLYIAGESYAGRYVPTLGTKILEQDPNIGSLEVNFQGIILGNAVFNRESIVDYSSIFYHWGIIDRQMQLAVKPLQDRYIAEVKKGNVSLAAQYRNLLLDKLDELTKQENDYNILLDSIDNLKWFVPFITRPDVREAIHVGHTQFMFGNSALHISLLPDFLMDVRTKVQTLLDSHYRVLIYCGQLDLTAPCVPNAEARRRDWRWNGHSQFLSAPRTPWWLNNRVAGYVKSGGGLTEVLVRGAGHLAPMDKPEEITNLITHFIQGADLPRPPYYHIRPENTPEYIEYNESESSSSEYQKSGLGAGLIVSVIFNVLSILTIVCGIFYALKWKRRNDRLFLEETSLDSAMI